MADGGDRAFVPLQIEGHPIAAERVVEGDAGGGRRQAAFAEGAARPGYQLGVIKLGGHGTAFASSRS